MMSQSKSNKSLRLKCNTADKQSHGLAGSIKKNAISSTSGGTTKKLQMPVLVEVKLPGDMSFSTSFKLTCFLSLLKDLNHVLKGREYT